MPSEKASVKDNPSVVVAQSDDRRVMKIQHTANGTRENQGDCFSSSTFREDHFESIQLICRELCRLRQLAHVDLQVPKFSSGVRQLSPRELDVLMLNMQGRTCKEIAARLEVGLATVAKHRARVFKKLCVKNSVELLYLLNAVFEELTPASVSQENQALRRIPRDSQVCVSAVEPAQNDETHWGDGGVTG
jgi:DNA-binding CsgD family transcriptional regulator